jgi:hypothetical protein
MVQDRSQSVDLHGLFWALVRVRARGWVLVMGLAMVLAMVLVMG